MSKSKPGRGLHPQTLAVILPLEDYMRNLLKMYLIGELHGQQKICQIELSYTRDLERYKRLQERLERVNRAVKDLEDLINAEDYGFEFAEDAQKLQLDAGSRLRLLYESLRPYGGTLCLPLDDSNRAARIQRGCLSIS